MKIKISFGFTLVELLVVVVITGLLSGGAIVFVNRGRASQKVMAAKNEMLANLRMVRNYAVSLQEPEGYMGEMTSVGVEISADGRMVAYPLPYLAGSSYFNRSVAVDGIEVAVSSDFLFFSAYEGKAFKGSFRDTPVVLATGETMSVTIGSVEDGFTKTVIVNNAGLIDEIE